MTPASILNARSGDAGCKADDCATGKATALPAVGAAELGMATGVYPPTPSRRTNAATGETTERDWARDTRILLRQGGRLQTLRANVRLDDPTETGSR